MAYMSEEGYKKLVAELQYLEGVRRPEIIQQIAEARDKGDLSENAEYDAAKEAQGHLEARISKLQELVANARLLDESKIDTSKVLLLSIITIRNVKNKMPNVPLIVKAKWAAAIVPSVSARITSPKDV